MQTPGIFRIFLPYHSRAWIRKIDPRHDRLGGAVRAFDSSTVRVRATLTNTTHFVFVKLAYLQTASHLSCILAGVESRTESTTAVDKYMYGNDIVVDGWMNGGPFHHWQHFNEIYNTRQTTQKLYFYRVHLGRWLHIWVGGSCPMQNKIGFVKHFTPIKCKTTINLTGAVQRTTTKE